MSQQTCDEPLRVETHLPGSLMFMFRIFRNFRVMCRAKRQAVPSSAGSSVPTVRVVLRRDGRADGVSSRTRCQGKTGSSSLALPIHGECADEPGLQTRAPLQFGPPHGLWKYPSPPGIIECFRAVMLVPIGMWYSQGIGKFRVSSRDCSAWQTLLRWINPSESWGSALRKKSRRQDAVRPW